jgi:hypothetical protein
VTPAERSFTDPLSNAVVLSSLDIARHMRQVIDKDLPAATLPAFLHEATHHWCINSPVGLAQLLLFFQARRKAWRFHRQQPADGDWDITDAVLRYEFAQALMKPLSEGIALFAEHDASTGKTLTISEPMAQAGALYARGLAVRTGAAYENMPLVLAGSRLTTAHIRRKADLLMQPFDYSDGGYLPGYLTVKTTWLFNLSHLSCPIFLDSDFFLQFFRAYFYDDWGMVACLLDDSRADIGALEPIAQRLQQRLIAFARNDGRDDDAKRFERSGKAGRPHVQLRAELAGTDLSYSDIDADENRSVRGKELLQALFRSLFDTWPSDPEEQMLIRLDLATLALAGTLTLAHGELDVTRHGETLQFHADDGAPLFSMPAPEALTAGWSGKLAIDIVANLMPIGLYVFLTSDRTLIAAHSLGKGAVPDLLKSPDVGPLVHLPHRLEVTRASRDIVADALKDDSIIYTRSRIADRMQEALPQIYTRRALIGVDDDALTSTQDRMRADGLLPLLDDDVHRLADAAMLSLSATLSVRGERLSAIRKWSKGDYRSNIDELNQLFEKRLGLAPFVEVSGKLAASFI